MKKEILSFNEAVLEVSSLLELEGEELDRVIGGALTQAMAWHCESYSEKSCGELTSCGTFNSNVAVLT